MMYPTKVGMIREPTFPIEVISPTMLAVSRAIFIRSAGTARTSVEMPKVQSPSVKARAPSSGGLATTPMARTVAPAIKPRVRMTSLLEPILSDSAPVAGLVIMPSGIAEDVSPVVAGEKPLATSM